MEGWQLYRKEGDRLLWTWGVLGVAWLISLVFFLRTIGSGSLLTLEFGCVLVGEVLLLGVGFIILDRKKKALIDAINTEYGVSLSTETQCREFLLEKILQRSAERFLSAAKEIGELLGMQRQFRGSNEFRADFYLKKIYDPESKQRLLAVALAAITVLTALMVRSIPEFSIFDALEDPAFGHFFMLLLTVSGGAFLMLVGAQVIFSRFWNTVVTWIAKSILSRESATSLRYLARDLILFHKSVEASTPRPPAEEGTAVKA
jgi:hypothetical protein